MVGAPPEGIEPSSPVLETDSPPWLGDRRSWLHPAPLVLRTLIRRSRTRFRRFCCIRLSVLGMMSGTLPARGATLADKNHCISSHLWYPDLGRYTEPPRSGGGLCIGLGQRSLRLGVTNAARRRTRAPAPRNHEAGAQGLGDGCPLPAGRGERVHSSHQRSADTVASRDISPKEPSEPIVSTGPH